MIVVVVCLLGVILFVLLIGSSINKADATWSQLHPPQGKGPCPYCGAKDHGKRFHAPKS